jgi:hypothetical protein
MAMWRAAVIWCMAVGACRVDRPVEHADALVERRESSSALETVATHIDPGDVPSLNDVVPPWLADELGITNHPDVAEIARRVAALPRDGVSFDATLLPPLRDAVALERTLAHLHGRKAVDAKFVLAAIYLRLHAATFFGRRGSNDHMRVWIDSGVSGTLAERRDELWEVLQQALGRAAARERRVLAELIREAEPDDPRLAAAMLAASWYTFAGPALREDVELAQAAIALRGDAVTADELLDASSICVRALDARCAKAMLDRARPLVDPKDPQAAKELAEVARSNEELARIDALANATGIEEQVERARLLMFHAHIDESLAITTALARRHPRDARIVVAREVSSLAREFDVVGSLARLEALELPLDHVGPEYCELAIGIRWWGTRLRTAQAGLTYEDAAAAERDAIAQITADARALAELGSDAGVVLDYAIRTAWEMKGRIGKEPGYGVRLADRVLVDAMKMHERFPTSRHVHRLLLAAAVSASDDELAERALALPLPADDHEGLVVEHRRTRFARALVRGRDPVFEPPVEAPPPGSFEARALTRIAADAAAIAAHRSGDAAEWMAALRLYADAIEDDFLDWRHANAIAVARIRAGDMRGGIPYLEQTLELARKRSETAPAYVLINLVALDQHPLDELRPLAESDDPPVRTLALAMLASGTKGRERARWQRRLAQEDTVPCADLDRGIALGRSINFEIGYGTESGLTLQLVVNALPWLLTEDVITAVRPYRCAH